MKTQLPNRKQPTAKDNLRMKGKIRHKKEGEIRRLQMKEIFPQQTRRPHQMGLQPMKEIVEMREIQKPQQNLPKLPRMNLMWQMK